MITTLNVSYLDSYAVLESNSIDESDIKAEAYQKALIAWDKANIQEINSKTKQTWINKWIQTYLNN